VILHSVAPLACTTYTWPFLHGTSWSDCESSAIVSHVNCSSCVRTFRRMELCTVVVSPSYVRRHIVSFSPTPPTSMAVLSSHYRCVYKQVPILARITYMSQSTTSIVADLVVPSKNNIVCSYCLARRIFPSHDRLHVPRHSLMPQDTKHQQSIR